MLFLFCFRADWSQYQDSHGNDTESDDPSQLHSSQGWRECLHIRFRLLLWACLLAYLYIQSLPLYGAEHTTERGSNLSVSLQITQPAQERLAIPPGSTSPTLFEQWCGFFYVPQEPDKCECCETGPTGFPPYPGLESLTSFAGVITKAALSPQLFKDPECLSGRGLNPRPPVQQTGALPTKLTRFGCFCRFFSLT